MPEPLGVAFIEIEPVAAGFRAKTEAQVRRSLAGAAPLVPPVPPSTTASVRNLAGAATQAATAEELLANANARLLSSAESLAVIENEEARIRFRAAAAAEVDAAAKQALLAVTNETTAATVREIEALNAKTGAASRAAIAEERAAFATAAHGTAARHATGHIAGEAGAMAGLGTAAAGLNGPIIAATVAAFALFKSLEQADEFNEQMHRIEAATGATEEQLKTAGDAAVAFGHDLTIPLTSAVDSAKAINLLVRSGFDLEEAIGAARGALLLTAASGQDLSTSVRTTDRILDAFNLTAEDSVRVADAIAIGMRFTTDSAEEFGTALAGLGPIANTVGLSLEEANTLVLQLSESGLSATSATGLLRQSFLRLVSGSKQVKEGLAEVGLNTHDLIDEMGHLRPDAFVVLGKALQTVNREQQLAILTQIFSRRSALAVIRLVDQQSTGYERMAAAAREAGAAEEEAAARTQSFKGQLSETKKEVADLGKDLGGLTAGPATLFLKQLNEIFRAGGNVAFVLTGIGKAAKDAGTGLASAVPGGERFLSTALKIVSLQAFPAFGIAKGINTIVDHFRKGKDDIEQILADLNVNISDALDRTAKAVEEGGAHIGSSFNSLSTKLAVAQATGTDTEVLAILREQRARAQERLERNQARTDLTRAQRQKQIQQAANDVKAADDAIQAILDRRKAETQASAADAQRKADDIASAASDRDDAFIRALQVTFETRQGAVTAAAADEALSNDIRANIKLRRFLTNAIEQTRKRIREVRAAGRDTADLAAALATFRAAKNAVRREIDALQAQAKAQAASTRVESTQLDLQILEARVGTDPTTRETGQLVRAHQRVIRALKRAQSLTSKRSLEYKRLQLEIEREREAIRNLRKAQRDTQQDGASFGQLSFQFLQQQQGVLSNFGPNFFPQGALAVGGGGGAPTGRAVRPPIPSPFSQPRTSSVAGKAAERGMGMTHGQANELVAQMRTLVHEMRLLRRGAGHPSNRHSEKWNKHLMDHGV